jgi:Cohesin domain/Secretion system C-terminal sorting domain
MNKKRTCVLVAFLWLLSFGTSWSQVGLKLPTYTNTSNGDQLDLPVTVVNFDTVFSLNMVIKWDPQVLEFQSLSFPANPLNLMDTTHFGLSQAVSDGILRMFWYTLNPRTLLDGKDIFHMNMKVIGQNGNSTKVEFTELPPVTYFEIVRGPGNQFFNLNTALLTQGYVGVGTVSDNEVPNSEISISAAPNPFSEQIFIGFDLQNSGETQLMITDVTGKICFEEKKYLNSGRNGTVIANTDLPAKGMYFVHLLTATGHTVHPIVFQ